MHKTLFPFIALVICAACLCISCRNTSGRQAGDGSGNREKLRKIQAVLESAIKSHKDGGGPGGLQWSVAVRDIVGAMAVCEPQAGIGLFQKLDAPGTGDSDRSVRTGAAMLLMRALKGSDRESFIELCRKTDDRELKNTVVEVMKVGSEKDLLLTEEMVDPSTMAGDATLLLAACDLKDAGLDWKDAAGKAAYSTDENFIVEPTLIIGALLRAYLNDDSEKAGEILKSVTGLKGRYEVTFCETAALPVKFMRDREGGDESAGNYIEFIDRSCAGLPEEDAFSVIAFAAKHYPDSAPPALAQAIRKRWKKEFLAGELSVAHFSTFYAARSLIAFNPEWSCQALSSLIGSLFSQKKPESHYHMIGTSAGLLARKDARSAMKLAEQIKSMEWIVNAKRCIYRGWAMREPDEAVASARKEYIMGGDVGKSLREDLLLEAAVGASLSKPELAAAVLAELPDRPVRFSQGYCLIAPQMARVDLDKAISLIVPKGASGGPVPADCAHALAAMALDIAAVPIDPTFPRFYPELMYPRDQWPGPYSSEPIRF